MTSNLTVSDDKTSTLISFETYLIFLNKVDLPDEGMVNGITIINFFLPSFFIYSFGCVDFYSTKVRGSVYEFKNLRSSPSLASFTIDMKFCLEIGPACNILRNDTNLLWTYLDTAFP